MPSVLDFQLKGARPSVALAIPTTEFIPRKAFMSQMLMMTTCWRPGDVFLTMPRIAAITIARNTIVEKFLEMPERVRFLMMIDSDMVVPSNLIERWVGDPTCRAPFISGYCTQKEYPYLPVVSRRHGTLDAYGETHAAYRPITNIAVNSGAHKVDGVGAACLCIRRDVLQAITPPWFVGPGEDYYFCRKVQEVATPEMPDGVWIVVDSGAEIGHIGESIAYPEDWFRVKDTYLADTGREEIALDEEIDGGLFQTNEAHEKDAQGHAA